MADIIKHLENLQQAAARRRDELNAITFTENDLLWATAEDLARLWTKKSTLSFVVAELEARIAQAEAHMAEAQANNQEWRQIAVGELARKWGGAQ
jgi:hypothetical protein